MSDQMAHFDTHLFAKRLKGSGFTDEQVDDLIDMAKASVPEKIVTEPILSNALTILEQRLMIRLSGVVAGLLAAAVAVSRFLG